MKEFYLQYRDQHPFSGFFMGFEPVLLLTDLNAIKSVLVSNFSSFTDHSFYLNERDDPLSAMLFSLSGERWRNMRTKLSPTFSNNNTRAMYETIYSIAWDLLQFIEVHAVQAEEPFNAKYLAMRFICDSIGSCGFGLNCGALTQSQQPYLLQVAENLFPYNRFLLTRFFLTAIYSKIARFLRIKLLPSFVTEYFRLMINETVKYREAHHLARKDFMNTLIQIKNQGCLTEDESGECLGSISYDDLQAQAFLIFFAGFHTSRVTLSFAMFELAVNQGVQERLREEVLSYVEASPDRSISYDALGQMTYLDQVVNGE